MNTRQRQSAFSLVECLIALSVIMLLMHCYTTALDIFATQNRIQLARLQCTAAAEAQLDNLTLAGNALPEEILATLWPDVTTTIHRSPGKGLWQGLDLVAVESASSVNSSPVRIRLSRYIPSRQEGSP